MDIPKMAALATSQLSNVRDHPDVARAAFADLDNDGRGNAKRVLARNGFTKDEILAVMPPRPRGPAPKPREPKAPKPVRIGRDAVGAQGRAIHKITADQWAAIDESGIVGKATVDTITAEDAAELADRLVSQETATATKVGVLTRLRHLLRYLGASDDVVNATYRPDLTVVFNKRLDDAHAAKVAVGFDIPAQWNGPPEDIAKALTRDITKLATKSGKPKKLLLEGDNHKLVPLLVSLRIALAARPGELDTLTIDKSGIVRGMLKKREGGDAMPYVGPVDFKLLRSALKAYQTLSAPRRLSLTRATRKHLFDTPPFRPDQDNSLRDLRVIGAELAVRDAVAKGLSDSDAARRGVRIAALRHAAPPRAATEHYAVVNR